AAAALPSGFALLERRAGGVLVRRLADDLATLALDPARDAVALAAGGAQHAPRLLVREEGRAAVLVEGFGPARAFELPAGVVDLVPLEARGAIAARLGAI